MTELGELRLRLMQDEDNLQEIYAGGFSDIKELQDEVRSNVDSGEWDSYIIFVEKAVVGGWDVVDSLGATVTEAGYEGIYTSLDAIPNEKVREAVRDVWEGVLMTQRENTTVPKDAQASWPLGRAVGAGAHNFPLGVLGHLGRSESGNAVVMVGNMDKATSTGWHHKVTVVMSPAERDKLIADLIAQRDEDNG